MVRHPLRHPHYSIVGLRCAGPVLLQGARLALHVRGFVGGSCIDGQGTGPALLRWVGSSLPRGVGLVLSGTLASEGSSSPGHSAVNMASGFRRQPRPQEAIWRVMDINMALDCIGNTDPLVALRC